MSQGVLGVTGVLSPAARQHLSPSVLKLTGDLLGVGGQQVGQEEAGVSS